MRLPLGIALAMIAATLAVVVARNDRAESEYRFAATFDSAKGLVPGQLVKLAGVRVGKVTDVRLAPGPAARVTMNINARLGPLHDDARCHILPEGLISENYVECSPGTTTRPVLKRGSDGVPQLPRARTTTPVSLQDLLNVFSLPVDQRVRAMINELGLATAGRGEDLDAIVRRANPTLQQLDNLLQTVNRQRERLADAVAQTDGVLARLARDRGSVRRFVTRSAAVTDTLASRRASLAATIKRLPATLDSARPALASIRRISTAGTPIVDDLRRAAPDLRQTAGLVPRFAQPGVPALRALGQLARGSLRPLSQSRRTVRRLRRAVETADPASAKLASALVDVRDRGGIEGVLETFYGLANLAAGYDSTSHFLSIYARVSPKCIRDAAARGCDKRYSAPNAGQIPVNEDDAPRKPATRAQLTALLEYLLR